jgi:hypothetical protein
MQLPAVAVRAALMHPTEAVRRRAFAYFSDSDSQDPVAADSIIQSREVFGPDPFLTYHNNFEHLKQTKASVRWVLDQLATRRGKISYGVVCSLVGNWSAH